jgi:hypothetical protein
MKKIFSLFFRTPKTFDPTIGDDEFKLARIRYSLNSAQLVFTEANTEATDLDINQALENTLDKIQQILSGLQFISSIPTDLQNLQDINGLDQFIDFLRLYQHVELPSITCKTKAELLQIYLSSLLTESEAALDSFKTAFNKAWEVTCQLTNLFTYTQIDRRANNLGAASIFYLQLIADMNTEPYLQALAYAAAYIIPSALFKGLNRRLYQANETAICKKSLPANEFARAWYNLTIPNNPCHIMGEKLHAAALSALLEGQISMGNKNLATETQNYLQDILTGISHACAISISDIFISVEHGKILNWLGFRQTPPSSCARLFATMQRKKTSSFISQRISKGFEAVEEFNRQDLISPTSSTM